MNTAVALSNDDLFDGATQASAMLKTLSHKDRLLILCELKTGEKSVGELGERLNLPQSPLSQHLARMRKEGLVKTRRQSQSIFYSLDSENASTLIDLLYEMFCSPEKS